ncbi:type VII secretion target [Nocardia bovistercoris]|uniref:ESX-1 secretion-associated protein n=1 Tax=Nocardia bovistercoris TaxID=2785916 RepID=A0A931IJQ3_9NOCA|nr:type VII secretion target [Nocardia bovistercoris]MBH0781888.1 hypothetical protein [Nocardia bovistercoris]
MTDNFSASTDRMRYAATAWDQAAYWLGEARGMTSGVEMTSTEAGVFALSLKKYEPAPGYVNDRLAEAVKACQDIAGILLHAANTYDEEDAARAQQLNSSG